MIVLLIGENSYSANQELVKIKANFDGEVERYDGEAITKNTMAEICQGVSLFSTKKLAIIRELSTNKDIWDELELWLSRINDDTTVVLVEPKPDKRTKSYKQLIKLAEVRECKPFSDRDAQTVERWLLNEAKTRQLSLDTPSARELVSRLGTDQWTLVNELERLSSLGDITLEVVKNYTPHSESEQVFSLLDTAFSGDSQAVHQKIAILKSTNDPYLTFGLLSSQVFNITALVFAQDKPVSEVARDIGQKEFLLAKLKTISRRLNHRQLEVIVDTLASTDGAIKMGEDPWMALENFLLSIARVSSN